jgi:transcriptional regulator with XRE-family HTH domain
MCPRAPPEAPAPSSVESTALMTPDRLRDCLHTLGWTQRDLADLLGIDDRSVRLYWAMGRGNGIPANVEAWLEELAALVEALPVGWTRPARRAPRERRRAA